MLHIRLVQSTMPRRMNGKNYSRSILNHLGATIRSGPRPRNVARTFDHLMSVGKVSASLKPLSDNINGGICHWIHRFPVDLIAMVALGHGQ